MTSVIHCCEATCSEFHFQLSLKKGVEQILGVFCPIVQNHKVTKGLIIETTLQYY